MAAPYPDLVALGTDVVEPDADAAARTRTRCPASLGRVAQLAEWLSGAQAASPPVPLGPVHLVVFGAPLTPTAQTLAAELDVHTHTVELDGRDVAEALAAGAALADDLVDSGAGLLLVACPAGAVGATVTAGVAAGVLVSVLTNTEPAKVVARGALATDAQAWMDRVVAIRDARRAAVALRDDPAALLAAVGHPAVAACVGFLLRSAARRTPSALDGGTALAAALLVHALRPPAARWWLAADAGNDPGARLAQAKLGLHSVLDLGLDTGDGTAALLALPALRALAGLVTGSSG